MRTRYLLPGVVTLGLLLPMALPVTAAIDTTANEALKGCASMEQVEEALADPADHPTLYNETGTLAEVLHAHRTR